MRPAAGEGPELGRDRWFSRLRQLDERMVGPVSAGRPSARSLVGTLLAGLVVAGVPAAVVVRDGGPALVAVLLPLLGLIPVGLLWFVGPGQPPQGR